VIPAGLGLKEDGASDGATVGFMISTPQTGVDSIAVSAAFLGWPFALFKLASAAIMGLCGGWLADRFSESSTARAPTATNMTSHARPGLKDGFFHAVNVLRTIWVWLVVGVVISAAITVWLPAAGLSAMNEWGGLMAGLVALAVSLPLYVCATASVPIAAALVGAGLPPGAALVFLMAGPASNVATMGAIYRALGRRMLVVYMCTLMIGSLVLGLLFDQVVNSVNVANEAMMMEHHGPFHDLAVALFVLSMAYFAWEDARQWWSSARAPESVHIRLSVSGMTCNGCRGKLERGLNADPDIEHASVILEPGEAKVSGTVDEVRLRALVAELGFESGPRLED